MVVDYMEQKSSIEQAILAIESGAQEYRIGTRTVRRADLAVLYGERARLEEKILSSQGGGILLTRLVRR